MSNSDLFLVYRKSCRWHSEYRNGHGSGPAIWGTLRKLFNLSNSFSDDERLWALACDSRVPRHLRLAHALTFDQAYCPIGNLLEMADALDQAHADILKHGPFTWSHFPAFAEAFRQIAAKHDQRLIGAAVNCTSVADVWHSHWTPVEREAWDCFAYAATA